MHYFITLVSFAFLFLTSSCATHTANTYRHYDSTRLVPAEESRLQFEDIVDISIDGINLEQMTIVERQMEPSSSNEKWIAKTLNGIVMIKPGKHHVLIAIPVREQTDGPALNIGWLDCYQFDFQSGVNYRARATAFFRRIPQPGDKGEVICVIERMKE